MKGEEHNKNLKKPGKNKEEYRKSILLFLRFSSWVAGPVIIAALIGNWLDSKYGTSPWIFLAAIGLAFIFSMVGLVKETSKEYKRIEEENKKDTNDNEQ